MKKKVLLVFGTRPEAIKMAPLVKYLQNDDIFETRVCVTAQHRQMLDSVLELFEIVPEYDLDIMKDGQDLYDITSNVLLGLRDVLKEFTPNIVLVHGDTTTSMSASLASFYARVPIGHIEAGLRTHNLSSPYPEEANRQLNSILANYHFAPTNQCKDNLLAQNIKSNIVVTGNTVIDALLISLDKIKNDKKLENKIIANINQEYNLSDKKIILVTGHRRENFGEGFENICNSLIKLASKNKDYDIVYPVHLNPNVQKVVNSMLSGVDNIYLIKPLDYYSFLYMMDRSYFIITDSGGIQEEAPSLAKPILVTRDTTEREEAVEAGTVILVGTDTDKIYSEAQKLIDDKVHYNTMAKAKNPYGDGKACAKIVKYLKENL